MLKIKIFYSIKTKKYKIKKNVNLQTQNKWILNKKINFLKEFLKEHKTVGAITASSKYLMKKMLVPIDFDLADVIVELGPGNGIFTNEILKKMKPTARLISFELNSNFCEHIRKNIKDEKLYLINESAEKMGYYLEAEGIDKVDYIVSSLPLSIIGHDEKERILNTCIAVLSVKGEFIQFQYSLNAKKLLQSKFKKVCLNFIPVNIPPAIVYLCTN